MREIKFRVWNKTWGEWVYPPGAEVSIFGETILLGGFMDGVNLEELNDCVVLQYTGVKDKSGREIYEGDLVTEDYFEPGVVHTVVFKDGGFWIGECLIDDLVEVIGNIHENPELCK